MKNTGLNTGFCLIFDKNELVLIHFMSSCGSKFNLVASLHFVNVSCCRQVPAVQKGVISPTCSHFKTRQTCKVSVYTETNNNKNNESGGNSHMKHHHQSKTIPPTMFQAQVIPPYSYRSLFRVFFSLFTFTRI